MRETEIMNTLERWSSGDVSAALSALRDSGLVQIVERYGTRFWSAAPGRYPEEGQSRRTAPDHHRQARVRSEDKPSA